ncbi:hypothetical protein HDU86_001522, partial [Geranomyces michiganensis]
MWLAPYLSSGLWEQYRKNVERSDFLISSGFVRSDNIDLLVVGRTGQPGLLCYYDLGAIDPTPYPPPQVGAVTNQTCTFFFVTETYANCTVAYKTEYFGGLPPGFLGGGPSDLPIGFWDPFAYFAPTSVPGEYLGVISFHWSQWQGLELGQKDAVASPIGAQLVTVGFEIFSQLLGSITTTENTAIAIWLTEIGALIATNSKNQSVLDPATLSMPFAQAYTPDNVPQPFIATAATALKTKYGDIFGKGYTPPSNFLPAATSDVFAGPNGLTYVETFALKDKYGFSVTIMLVIPQADLLGPMVSTRKKVLTTSLVVAFAMLLLAVATSVIVTHPVRRLTIIMGQATKMDFSALQGGYLKNQSWILELARMQEVFGTMLQRFAAAIQANKNLQGSGRVSASGVQPTAAAGK